jgi:hypothetical protein
MAKKAVPSSTDPPSSPRRRRKLVGPKSRPPQAPRWVLVPELHARHTKRIGSLVEADQSLTVEFRKDPLEGGIRTMRDPERAGERDLPEAESSLDAIRQDLPAARVPLHEWFRRWEIRSFPGGAVCAVPLDPPYVSRIMELRDFYACLPDYEKIFRHLPEDSSPFAPGALTDFAAALEELQLKPPTRKQSDEAAARKKLDKKKDEEAPDSLQRQIGWAIIGRVYPNVAVTNLPHTADVHRTVRRWWEAGLRDLVRNTNPMNVDSKKKTYVKPPSYQTVRRMLERDPDHK